MPHTIRICSASAALLLSVPVPAGAQGYDPRTQSPLTLLTAPNDPLAYFDARLRARALLSQGRAAEAEPVAEQITREYPRDGENWFLLGEVKESLKKHAEAATAFERAGKLLWWGGPANFAMLAANSYLRADDTRSALDMLRHHTRASWNMSREWSVTDAAASLRTDPEFLEISGRFDTTGWSRDYGWRRDVDFLRDEVKRLNADYRTAPLPPEFERRYEELKQKVPQLSDEQIYVAMNRMLAVLRQGHTQVRALNNSRVAYKGLPFQLWAFPEGMFIVAAQERYEDLVGSRLVSIEEVAAEEVLRRVNENQSVDGDNEYLYVGVQTVRDAAYLVGLGVAKTTGSIQVTVEQSGQSQRTLTAETSAWYASDKLGALKGVTTPLYLQGLTEFHWHRELPDHDALYVQLNQVADEEEESLTQYALQLRDMLRDTAPRNVILDMRHNDGGSTHIYAEFLRTMIGFSLMPDRRLYVLIGRNTYSAAANLVTELEQLAAAVFVGEASSECCTFYASPSGFTLPFSRFWGRVPTRRINLSRKGHDFRRELNPHAPVVITAKDYFAGRDPMMETVYRMIERE